MLVELERDTLQYKIEHIFSFNLNLAKLEVIGVLPEGLRVNVYILGGKVDGPQVKGIVRPVGGNWTILDSAGMLCIDYHLTFETQDGALIYVTCIGSSDCGEDGYQKYFQGQLPAVHPHRTSVKCRTAHPDYQWLNRLHCLGIGQGDAKRLEVIYDVYSVT
jgi:Protein of unknown function (DUF3237)